MILDGGKKSNSLFRMCNEGALYDVPIIMGTHTDVCIHKGPSMIRVEFTEGRVINVIHKDCYSR